MYNVCNRNFHLAGTCQEDTDDDKLNPQCRICLEEISGKEFISLCECKGTLKYMHSMCLRRWIIEKTKVKCFVDRNVIYLKVKNLFCELCNSPFPTFTRGTNNAWESVFNALQFKTSYSLFEKMSSGFPKEREFIVYDLYDLMKPEVKRLRLSFGRDEDNDVCLADSFSLSRIHFYVIINKSELDHIEIKDNHSKYGISLLSDYDEIISLLAKEGKVCFQVSNKLYKFEKSILKANLKS